MLDTIIRYFSPAMALKRAHARQRLRAFDGIGPALRYDAARRNSRTASWAATSIDASTLYAADGARLRNVARELVRNNAHAARARHVIADGLIGPGVIPTIYLPGQKDRRATLEKALARLADEVSVDADGRNTLYGMQHMWVGTVVQDGEVLILREWQATKGKVRPPIRLKAVECDMLDTAKHGPLANGNRAVLGVEFDKAGNRVAYHILKDHPAGYFQSRSVRSERWDAKDVCHMYRVDRPGQVRGFSWFAPVALSLNDYRDYMDAQLVRQRIAASFAAFVRRSPQAGPMNLVASSETSKSKQRLEAIEAGIIQYLDDDEDIVFGTPPSVDGVHEYSKVTLRAISTGLNIDYAAMTGDYGDQNFAGGRIGHLRFQRTIDSWYAGFVGPAMETIGRWFLEAMAMDGEDVTDAAIKWSPPVREMYDPVKETQATNEAISGGLTSRPEEQRRRGHDPELLEQEIAEANDRADAAGLVFSNDARHGPAPASKPDPASAGNHPENI